MAVERLFLPALSSSGHGGRHQKFYLDSQENPHAPFAYHDSGQ
jgi:hypothetical protein